MRLAGAVPTWVIGVNQLLAWGAFYYALPAFVAPISADLGWSRELVFAGLSAALLTAVMVAPVVGREVDRGRGKRAMLAGQLLGSLALAALATVDSAAVFLLLCCLIGVSQSACLYDSAFSLLHRRLGPDAPAAIIRVTLVAGFAGTVFVPAAQYCVDQFGWRNAALLMSLGGVAAFVLTATLIGSEKPAAASSEDAELLPDFETACWTPSMVAALVAFAASTAVFSTITIHFLPLLIDRGLPGITAAQFFAVVGPSQIAARLLLFLLPPGTSAVRYGAVVFLLQAAAVALLMAAHGGPPLLIFAVIFGASSGLLTIVRGVAPAEICGRGMIGRLNGAIGAVGGLARAIAPAAFAFGLAAIGPFASLAILLALSIAGGGAFAVIGPLERRRLGGVGAAREA